MKLVLTPVAGEGTALTFDKMPSVEISCTTGHKDGTAVAQYKDTTWVISGVLLNGSTTIATQLAALETLLANGRLLSAKIQTDASEDVIDLSNDYDIKISTYTYPSTGAPEFATRRTFTITLNGREYVGDAATNGIYTYTISYTTNQSGVITRDINITYTDDENTDASAKRDSLIDANDWLVWTNAVLTNKKLQTNDNDSAATANITHVTLWLAYPTDITNCEISEEISIDKFGTVLHKQSGWFEGTTGACDTAIATRLALAANVISNSKTRQPYSNKTNFSIESLASTGQGNADVYHTQETISIVAAIIKTVFKPVLGGVLAPVKQVTCWSTATATQSGVIKRISTWPIVPAAKWPDDLISSSITRLPLENRASGYVIQYSYTFEFVATPSF